jgi:hypothetical protein
MPSEIKKKLTLLTLTVLFLFALFNLILDAPHSFLFFAYPPPTPLGA